MQFVRWALVVLAVMLAVAAFGLFRGEAMAVWLFPAATWGGIVVLAVVGFYLYRRGHVHLGAVALTVQGFGVFTLMLGLAIGVSVLVSGRVEVTLGRFEDFKPMVWPIVEGFVGAGLATLLVVILRLTQSVLAPPEGGGSGHGSGWGGGGDARPAGAAAAAEYARVTAAVNALVAELERAKTQAAGLGTALSKVNGLVANLGAMLENLDRFFTEKP